MKQIYQNNQEIVTFFSKAQTKIGELTALIATEDVNEQAKELSLDLSDFLESLDSIYCTFSIVDCLRYIHYWNKRANLTAIPFIQITDYVVNINTGSSPNNSSNLDILVKTILATTPHNSLAALQGGSITERYHLSKAELEWLKCQMSKTPCPNAIGSNVTISLFPNKTAFPSGYYELGETVGVVTVKGFINYGTEKQVLSYEYRKNNLLLGNRIDAPGRLAQPNIYMDTTSIKTNTIYSFSVEFTDGVKSAQSSILFKQPMYYGIIEYNRKENTTFLLQGVKDVRDKGQMTLSYQLPIGNTLVADDTYKIAYLFVDRTWGKFSSAIVSGFDFSSDWQSIEVNMPLKDGSTKPALLLYYPIKIEGTNTFTFNW